MFNKKTLLRSAPSVPEDVQFPDLVSVRPLFGIVNFSAGANLGKFGNTGIFVAL